MTKRALDSVITMCAHTNNASDHSLYVHQSGGYYLVKESILWGYVLVPEAYRQQLRNYTTKMLVNLMSNLLD